MDYHSGVATLSSSDFGYKLREMCADRNSEVSGDQRWTLTVGEESVPVMITTQTKASYPEIRLFPFFDEEDRYMGYGFGRTAGNETYGEDTSIEYLRKRSDISLRTIRSHIDIYAKTLSGVSKIRDSLVERLLGFRIAQCRFIQEIDEEAWEQDEDDTNIYKNANFNSDSNIVSVYDGENQLLKAEDLTEGTWNISDDGLSVYPLTKIDNLKMKELVVGSVFPDGSTMLENGIMNFRIVRSQPQKGDKPHLHHWTIHTVADYKDIITTEYKKSYKQVDVNG